nr:DNA repair protein RecO [Oceanirhabdus seepicola]
MSIINSRGIVLNSFDIKENDKIVWMYTEKLGKISVIARGARKKNSKITSLIQGLCFANYSIYKGKSAYFLNEGIIIDSFQDLLRDFETIAYSSYICELINLSIPENEKNFKVFENAIKALYLIKNSVGDIELLIRSFEVKLISSMGYHVNIEKCSECGSSFNNKIYFNNRNFSFVCKECNNSFKEVSLICYTTLRALVNFPIEKIYRINALPEAKKEIGFITNVYLNEICCRRPKSLDMLNFL